MAEQRNDIVSGHRRSSNKVLLLGCVGLKRRC